MAEQIVAGISNACSLGDGSLVAKPIEGEAIAFARRYFVGVPLITPELKRHSGFPVCRMCRLWYFERAKR
jgi:hypothetical protein